VSQEATTVQIGRECEGFGHSRESGRPRGSFTESRCHVSRDVDLRVEVSMVTVNVLVFSSTVLHRITASVEQLTDFTELTMKLQ